ncbi:AAA+ family ATPase [Cereibacter changlensis]|uniref:AAA+ family ATPase n=1 Tax=Cereibacter changlensis TaxID=402884 RepID=A0A4U0Z2J9_9RHOB|nr:AAA+ family ATPase [Cereibacter changlensis]TKA97529.1 AAA+ family ATPase [Cereibacter changlensis]
MKQLIAPLALCLSLTAVQAQEPLPEAPPLPEASGDVEDGFSLLGEGARLLFRGLMDEAEPMMDDMGQALKEMQPAARELLAMIGDLRHYEAPERLPNGDILIRRKADAPPLEPEPEKAEPEAPSGEIEL